MTALLLDANLSPETSAFLRGLGLDATDLSTRRLADLTDLEIVALAKSEMRTIVTFDLDFGEIYYRAQRGQIGVIILRLGDHTIEAVNAVLGRFFATLAPTVDLGTSLIMLGERRVRITDRNDANIGTHSGFRNIRRHGRPGSCRCVIPAGLQPAFVRSERGVFQPRAANHSGHRTQVAG